MSEQIGKILTPFKMQVLTNFPYIEADFDALTNYQLLCKIVEYLNNVIGNENELTVAVNNLYDYVNNYFDNLDVQEEIDKKLDEMAEDGTLTNLIKNYVDPIYEAYEETINERLNTQDERLDTQDETIDERMNNQDEAIDVLEARMDTFSTLTEGSTSGDAELADIRIGFNGKTYTNAGTSVRSQALINYTPIANYIDKTLLLSDFSNNGVVTNTGISANVNYKYTNPILIKAGEILNFTTWTDNSTVYAITLSNANGDLISPIKVGVQSDYIEFTNKFKENTYVILCININALHDLWSGNILKINNDKLNEIEEKTKDYEILNFYDKGTKTEGKTVDQFGAVSNASGGYLHEFEVKPSTAYYITQSSNSISRICFYDQYGKFIANVYTLGLTAWNNEVTSPNNAYYCKARVDNTYLTTAYFGLKINYNYFNDSYYSKFSKNVYVPSITDSITIGTGGDFETLYEGFTYAQNNNKIAVILPGTYDLSNTGAFPTYGLVAPKHIIGYGAKIICNSSTENWNFSPLNINPLNKETIIEGLEIEVTNVRYCIHDEMYTRDNYYHNVYKNLKLTHNSESSATLIRPICIGGGFGNSGLIEIDNCICSSKDNYNGAHEDINYHSLSTGQTGNCIVKCNNSLFENGIGISSIGSSTSFMNTMYVGNCASKRSIPDYTGTNAKLIKYNIAVISNIE